MMDLEDIVSSVEKMQTTANPTFIFAQDLFIDMSDEEFRTLVKQMNWEKREDVLNQLQYAYHVLNSDSWMERGFMSWFRK